jgi:hypothetical protein
MSKISLTVAVILAIGLSLSSQSFAAQVTYSRDVVDTLPFEIPTLQRMKGTIRPSPGHRLHIVAIVLGDESIAADVRRFTLVTSRGITQAIGAGSGDSLVPFDRIPVGQEVGQVLPSDALLVLTRTSTTNVMLELGPRGAIAFLFDVPLDATMRVLRMPDGRELALTP